ncbi:hypothetical protein [Novosphingobium mangrovi (ex Huang et al. 2023)]|uniref:Uncharacterized protein n=1 Tax=Novosphingobium mangrovi (ex Huang et al. 2023) TaxID=2976432 RepID=A0ABT2I2I4_9SPHN|nr:hypothetical protein [Novosphingobium mangrovi (ex Huang et al. 2023)]MCT2398863.1 hypothetical protein [Novosphingobium mangrovi (ex Huang et al. 2023)]
MSRFTRFLAPALALSLGLGAALPASAAEPTRAQSGQIHHASQKADFRKAQARKDGLRHSHAHASKQHDCKHGKHMAMKDNHRHDRHDSRGHEHKHGDRQNRDGRRG